MRKVVFFLIFLALSLSFSPVWAQGLPRSAAGETVLEPSLVGPGDSPKTAPGPARLLSPSAAQALYETAYELAKSKVTGPAEVEQAIVFLKAALELDSNADYVRPTLIELACRNPNSDHSELVKGLLAEYISPTADLDIAQKAVSYLLMRGNSREEREKILEELLMIVGNKNAVFGSDLVTQLGLLMTEKPDNNAAGFYLTQAWQSNEYNSTAFEKLVQLFPDKLGPEAYLRHLRLALRKDPSNIDATLGLGRYAERLEMFDMGASVYQYAAELFRYLYPGEPLSARIYIPWAISSYNAEGQEGKCLEIANAVRQTGRFDLLLETLAGKAAAKLGDGERATQILQGAQEKARKLLVSGPGAGEGRPQVTAKQFAWFYCFGLPNPEKALEWANKAYASEPNAPSSASILAYALMMNEQSQWAKPIIEKSQPDQIGELVLAEIQYGEDNKDLAKMTLTSAIARDPGSLAAEQAKAMLAKQGADYIPAVAPDVVRNMLEQAFGKTLVPVFTPPEQLFSVQFNMRGNKFPYGSELSGVVAIVNNSSETLIVADGALFGGNIRIDAEVTGDLNLKIPELVAVRVRDHYFIDAGQSVLVPVKLVTDKLKLLLNTFPQASVDIELTLYIDPVITADGEVTNRLAMIEPTRLLIRRPGIELTSEYLKNRFNLIWKGQEGQKIKTAQLFVGLLKEQYAMSNRKPPYKFVYADWMSTMFRNALVHEAGLLRNPAEGEWLVKVHTMAQMVHLPLDHEMVTAVSENLNDRNWPVRMMTVYLLAKTQKQKFEKVLEWAATYDPDAYVREMAAALSPGGPKAAEPENPPTIQEPSIPEPPKGE